MQVTTNYKVIPFPVRYAIYTNTTILEYVYVTRQPGHLKSITSAVKQIVFGSRNT